MKNIFENTLGNQRTLLIKSLVKIMQLLMRLNLF